METNMETIERKEEMLMNIRLKRANVGVDNLVELYVGNDEWHIYKQCR